MCFDNSGAARSSVNLVPFASAVSFPPSEATRDKKTSAASLFSFLSSSSQLSLSLSSLHPFHIFLPFLSLYCFSYIYLFLLYCHPSFLFSTHPSFCTLAALYLSISCLLVFPSLLFSLLSLSFPSQHHEPLFIPSHFCLCLIFFFFLSIHFALLFS